MDTQTRELLAKSRALVKRSKTIQETASTLNRRFHTLCIECAVVLNRSQKAIDATKNGKTDVTWGL